MWQFVVVNSQIKNEWILQKESKKVICTLKKDVLT